MSNETRIVPDKIAFEGDTGSLHFKATYLLEPKGEALVEITRDGETVRSFLWPAYKVWNIAAHAEDIAADINAGLWAAGDNLLGGNCAPTEASNR